MDTQSTLLMIGLAPDDLASLQTLLAGEGYRLLAAASLVQALDMLEREHVDVVIGDISLSDRDGIELCRQIRQQPDLEELPILLIAAAEDHQIRLQSLQAGADDFISKPLSFTEVGPRLRTITRLNRFRQLAEQSDRLAFLTLYDPQTLLPNERYLNQYLPDELRQSRQRGQSVALLYIDLDGFQMINSTLGFRVTDLLLQEAVTRLRLLTEPDSSRRLVRMGNDKFIIVQTERCNILELAQTADQIQQALQVPMASQAGEMRLTASIGISVFPQDAQDSEGLIAAAAMSMMLSRQQGRGGYQFVSQHMNQQLRERLHLEQALRRAVERDELFLDFQPKVLLATGQLHSVEALVRWRHPQQGLLPPQQFISLAEERGLIVPVSRWVLNAACRQLKQWRQQGKTDLTVAVNISSWEFIQQDLVLTVRQALERHQLPGEALELELTESVLMADIGNNKRQVIEILDDLKAIGVTLALDDFGTGYSSLSYLKRFPVDLLKIDQLFVRGMTQDADDAAIVRTIIKLAHSLRLKVIAEGIETGQQRDFLQQQGCDYGQGNLFSPALSPAEFEHRWATS